MEWRRFVTYLSNDPRSLLAYLLRPDSQQARGSAVIGSERGILTRAWQGTGFCSVNTGSTRVTVWPGAIYVVSHHRVSIICINSDNRDYGVIRHP